LKSKALLMILLSAMTVGCMTSTEPNVYQRSQLQRSMTTTFGTLITYKPITIKGEGNVILNVAGTAIGAIAGAHIGGGTGRLVSGIASGVGAGYATDAATKALSRSKGYELTVKLNNGDIVTFAQEGEIKGLQVGQTLKLTRDNQGNWRVDNQ
jgi:putative lipoprotein